MRSTNVQLMWPTTSQIVSTILCSVDVTNNQQNDVVCSCSISVTSSSAINLIILVSFGIFLMFHLGLWSSMQLGYMLMRSIFVVLGYCECWCKWFFFGHKVAYEELEMKEMEVKALLLNGEDMFCRCQQHEMKGLQQKLNQLQVLMYETKTKAKLIKVG